MLSPGLGRERPSERADQGQAAGVEWHSLMAGYGGSGGIRPGLEQSMEVRGGGAKAGGKASRVLSVQTWMWPSEPWSVI